MMDRVFQERAERLADELRARYGVQDIWTDERIERALADHGMPALSMLPAEPRGMMAETYPQAGPLDLVEAHRWQRVNAMHLVAHAMLHGGERCGGCRDWGSEP